MGGDNGEVAVLLLVSSRSDDAEFPCRIVA